MNLGQTSEKIRRHRVFENCSWYAWSGNSTMLKINANMIPKSKSKVKQPATEAKNIIKFVTFKNKEIVS